MEKNAKDDSDDEVDRWGKTKSKKQQGKKTIRVQHLSNAERKALNRKEKEEAAKPKGHKPIDMEEVAAAAAAAAAATQVIVVKKDLGSVSI